MGIATCGLWLYAVLYLRAASASLPKLRDVALPDATMTWPPVSVVVPACNEADRIEISLASLLALDYPDIEVIVVDDRSTDATGRIVDEMAARSDRLRVIHLDRLPDGWLGKVHAMHRAVREARGDWILFTDADVEFAPDSLRRALTEARSREVSHLTCIPEVPTANAFWLSVAIHAFSLLFAVSVRLRSVNRDASHRPIGIGAFNLVEAAALARSRGLEWLRLEPADDMGIGLLLEQAGARTRLLHGDGMLRVPWYPSLRAMVKGLEKNGFGPGARYSYLRQVAIVLYLAVIATAPIVSLGLGIALDDTLLLAAGLTAVLGTAGVALSMPRQSLREALAYFALPAGVVIFAYIMARAAWLCFRHGGIDWRGTRYDIDELRRGQRVKF